MKIGIISDTHDHVSNIKAAVTYLNAQNVDRIYHCGDWVAPFTFEFFFTECQPQAPVIAVLGNNEGDRYRLVQRLNDSQLPISLDQHTNQDEFDGKKAILYHGQDKRITAALIKSGLYDLVCTGHTHQSLIEKVGQTLHINPGPVTNSAKSKIIDNPTLAIYDSTTHTAKIIEFLKETL